MQDSSQPVDDVMKPHRNVEGEGLLENVMLRGAQRLSSLTISSSFGKPSAIHQLEVGLLRT